MFFLYTTFPIVYQKEQFHKKIHIRSTISCYNNANIEFIFGQHYIYISAGFKVKADFIRVPDYGVSIHTIRITTSFLYGPTYVNIPEI